MQNRDSYAENPDPWKVPSFKHGEGQNLFNSVPRPIGSSGGHEGQFSRDLLSFFFSAEGPCEQFRHGQGRPLFDVVHPAFPLCQTQH